MNRESPVITSSALSQSRLKSWEYIIDTTKLKVASVSEIITNNAVFPLADRVKLQFVIFHQVTQLFNVKRCQSCTTANQYGFCCLS